jgi:glutamate formiminotransferase/formiminotetrahydrofolate cyclodeaminase
MVAQIVQSITDVSGIILLDYSYDHDHNRSVVTYVGPPEAVEEAAFRSIKKAAEVIDMEHHEGEHPRIGATDVVPFVPISGVTMQDCVEMARRVGARVGKELGIPVYLYEEAATRPEHENLATIRKGEYETLKEEIGTNPDRAPDFGPTKVGKAGATVIGARQPLVAYNVFLNTDDLGIAKKIASAVRHSSGGLAFVKALGMLVDGRAQVSMNLTNFRKTPVFRVVEMIRREAAHFGVTVQSSELIGLIPMGAITDAAAWYLQLEDFHTTQVLETRIQSAQSEKEQILPIDTTFMQAVASDKPTPGGGSVSAHTAAMAAALVAMVARLTLGRKKYAQVEEEMQMIVNQATLLQESLTKAIQIDSEAFDKVIAAFKIESKTDAEKKERMEAIQKATLHATEVPLSVAAQTVQVLELAEIVISKGNLNAITDGGTGAALARAALSGAGMNVRINLANLDDKEKATTLLSKLETLEDNAYKLSTSIHKTLAKRADLALK